jgi:hypothetical protein
MKQTGTLLKDKGILFLVTEEGKFKINSMDAPKFERYPDGTPMEGNIRNDYPPDQLVKLKWDYQGTVHPSHIRVIKQAVAQ